MSSAPRKERQELIRERHLIAQDEADEAKSPTTAPSPQVVMRGLGEPHCHSLWPDVKTNTHKDVLLDLDQLILAGT